MKAVELAAECVSNFLNLGSNTIIETLATLVANGELIEVEYSVPDIPYRVKSFLLPKGSQLFITNRGDLHANR